MDEHQPTVQGAREERRRLVERAVDTWVKQLIDLTGRNQLLYYRTLKRGTLELTKADPERLDRLLSGGPTRLSELFRPTSEDPERFDEALSRARAIHAKGVEHFEERGIQTLFAAVGMATWSPSTSKATPASPVLLCPLELKPHGAARSDFTLALGGDWEINATLLHLLNSEFSVDIDPTALLDAWEPPNGIGGFDATSVLERIQKEALSVPSFFAVDRVVAGTFLYTKLPMVKDLQASIDELVANDLISAIAGSKEARDSIRALTAVETDPSKPDYTPPADEFLILDSDASQTRAINAAIDGEPLVIQGPPGTGKSQTIANLIATSMARGQRVLFVAEKRAAIDAVTKRLRIVGLDDLVLDLHGGVTSKKKLAAEIGHTLSAIGRTPHSSHPDLHADLASTRQTLVDHVKGLHRKREPWNLSLWDVQQDLLRLAESPDVSLRFTGSRLQRLDHTTARALQSELREWVRLAAPLLTEESPWTGALIHSEEQARKAQQLVSDLAFDAVPHARSQLDRIIRTTGLRAPESVGGWDRLLTLLVRLHKLLESATENIWTLDLDGAAGDLAPAGHGWWSRTVAQLSDADYRAAKRRVREVATDPKAKASQLREMVESAGNAAGEWRALGGSGDPRTADSLNDALDSYSGLSDRLAALGAYLATRDLTAADDDRLQTDVQQLAADQQTLFRLPRIHELEQGFDDFGLGPLLDAVRRNDVPHEEISESFEVCRLQSIRTEFIAGDPGLASFDGRLHDEHVDRFQVFDEVHLETTADRVRRAVAESAVAARQAHPDQDEIVRGQANRKRGHLPLRRLIEQAPDVMTSLRPCWVMSPLIVSQSLPARPLFDLVIFDEASQVLPADAVPALLRAPRAVVAGDRHQLPPTTFFDAGQDEEGEEELDGGELTAGFESILDVLNALLRDDYMLTWHYRSHDERLIAFSNHRIYDSGLTTFPGAVGRDCLKFELVPHRRGVHTDTRSNDDEVERVVELMIDHAKERPNESLGVIAMGIYHANRVEALLRRRLFEMRNLDLDKFFDDSLEERAFVKNLERVQGDERDAIILSIGYGKNADGRLMYRFGPLNQDGGERRLNVAVTRARRRLTLVSSFSHTDMEPGRSSARGVELMRLYLKYVASGGDDLEGAEHAEPLNPFEISVKNRLESEGLHVIPQYGTSGYRIDFAVVHPTDPGRMVLAIEADGASYHSSYTARDRDRLRQQVLESHGWRFHRIWSTDWFNNQDRSVARLLDDYRHALSAPLETQPSAEPRQPTTTPAPTHPERTGQRPYIRRGTPITEYSHRQLVQLARWIKSDTLLRTDDEILSEMVTELGYSRRGSRIVDAFRAAIRDS